VGELYSLIHQGDRVGELHDTKICGGAPPITHLCFRICGAPPNTYERASGQAINLNKSKIFLH